MPPPARSLAKRRCSGRLLACSKPKLDLIIRTSPMAPDATRSIELRRLRMQAVHVGFGHERAGLARRMEHRVGFPRGQRHGLLAEHVLAALGRLDRPFGVMRMRRGDVDRLDFRIVDQRLIAVDDPRPGKILRKPRPARIARADRNQLAGPGARDACRERPGDAPRADNAPADGGRILAHALLLSFFLHALMTVGRILRRSWCAIPHPQPAVPSHKGAAALPHRAAGGRLLRLGGAAPGARPWIPTQATHSKDRQGAFHGGGALSRIRGDLGATALSGPGYPDLDDYDAAAFKKNQAALCLSGGGIRSAAFALGVIEGLAKKGLLTQFHYLSTVSGGGYIGGFVTRWIHEKDGDAKQFSRNWPRAATPGLAEPEPIQWLREYSNFLTPNTGLASSDTWSAGVLWIRNTLVNWFLFLPAFLAAVAVPNFYLASLPVVSISPVCGIRVPVPGFGADNDRDIFQRLRSAEPRIATRHARAGSAGA